MTIVSGPDKRNEAWANDKSAFGQRMLMKMGWSEGKGLGKNKQGTSSHLRAIRREEGLGIGAKTDTFGDDGFSKTSQNFHGVLAQLHAEHGNAESNKSKKKSKKKKKDSKKEKGEDSSSLTLSKNKVTAGHARKMRESKDLTKKSKEDMAAIFGMKVDQYQSNSVWGKLSSLNTNTSSEQEKEETSSSQISESENSSSEKRRKEKKKRKREKVEIENGSKADAEDKKKKKKSKKRRKQNDS